MANPKRKTLGAFPIGAIPASLEHTFFEFDEVTEVNLTGFTSAFARIQGIPPVVGQGGNLVVADPASGVVLYNWIAADTSRAGDYELQMWVILPSGLKLHSDLFLYSVYDGPGAPP